MAFLLSAAAATGGFMAGLALTGVVAVGYCATRKARKQDPGRHQ
mgnify:CR=1 FL=1